MINLLPMVPSKFTIDGGQTYIPFLCVRICLYVYLRT